MSIVIEPKSLNNMSNMVEQEITVKVPASSANLGPGFDTVGLALALYATFTFRILKENDDSPVITITKGDGLNPAEVESNLAYKVFKDLWHGAPEAISRLRIEISTDIPMGRGLGSSSTAILAAACAARSLSHRSTEKSLLLRDACPYEGHADNLSASLFGGLTLCGNGTVRDVLVHHIRWPQDWKVTVIVPHRPLLTHEARAVLPKYVKMTDAVSNIQNVALFLSAVQQHDAAMAAKTMFDRLHEQYRAKLVPELTSLQRSLRGERIIGCVLSGAGSSILVVYEQRHQNDVIQKLTDWRARNESGTDILNLNVDRTGLTLIRSDGPES